LAKHKYKLASNSRVNKTAVLHYMGMGFVYSDYNFALSPIKQNGLFLKLMA